MEVELNEDDYTMFNVNLMEIKDELQFLNQSIAALIRYAEVFFEVMPPDALADIIRTRMERSTKV